MARQTGGPAVTVRAWERRYGFPAPSRARGGRRLYTERDIRTIQAPRAQTTSGVPVSRAIAVLHERSLPAPSAGRALDGGSRSALGRRFVEALLAMAPARSEAVLAEALAQWSVEDVCRGLIQPALNEIGRRWHAGEASIAQEHFASAVVRARLASMLHHALATTDQPAILAACPPGEWHELGLLMTSLFLARRGESVRYLGANLPAHDLADAVRTLAPRLVLLSAQTDATAESLRQVFRTLSKLRPPLPSWRMAAGRSPLSEACASVRQACSSALMPTRR